MIERIFEFLSTFEPLWMAISYISAIAIALAVGMICIMIAVRVSEFFIGFTRKHSSYLRTCIREARDKFYEKIGEHIGKAAINRFVEYFKSPIPVDLRPKIVGRWMSDRGDIVMISRHEGYFIMEFEHCIRDETLTKETFILRYPQGWLCDDNVYYAEGRQYFSLAASDSADEIYLSELRAIFKRCELPDEEVVSRIKKELDERIGEIRRPSSLDIAFNEPASPDEINDNILK